MAKLYIAGPMTGYSDYNFPSFDAAQAALEAAGHTVFNPAQNDRDNGFDAMGLEGHEAHEHGFDLRVALKQDLSWICEHADGVALLRDWEFSKGAAAEVALAVALGIPALEVEVWMQKKVSAAATGHPTEQDTTFARLLPN